MSQQQQPTRTRLTREEETALYRQEEVERWAAILEGETKRKNILTESEFEPIFMKSEVDFKDIDSLRRRQELQELSREYFDRINPYDEVTIVSDMDHTTVVATLPKMYVALKPLSKNHDTAITDFDNMTSVAGRKDIQDEGRDKLLYAIVQSQDLKTLPYRAKEEKARYRELASKVVASPTEKVSNPTSSSDTNDQKQVEQASVGMDWDDFNEE